MSAAQVGTKREPRGAPPEMERLRSLVGEWDVQFEGRDGPDQPFKTYRTTSRIIPLLGGAFLQETLAMPTPTGRPIALVGIWGYDRFRRQYRFAWLDDTYALFDVHEGEWGPEGLVVTNVRSGTTLRMGAQEVFGRMVWSDLSQAGFAVESSASLDGGKTWFVQAKGRYTRRQ